MPEPNDWVTIPTPKQAVDDPGDWQTVSAGAPEPQRNTLMQDVGVAFDQTLPGQAWNAVKSVVGNPKQAWEDTKSFLKDPYTPTLKAVKGIVYDAPRDLIAAGKQKMEQGDLAGGARTMIAAAIPVFGPAINEAGEDVNKGNYRTAAFRTAGIASNLVTPEAARAAAEKIGAAGKSTSRWLAKSALKPNKYVGNKAQIDRAVDVELGEGYSPDARGLAALRADKNATGRGIRQTYEGGEGAGTVKFERIQSAVDDLKKDLLPSEQAAVDSALEADVYAPFRDVEGTLHDMTPAEAFDLKVKLQNAVSKANKQFYRSGIGTPGTEGRATVAGSIGDQLLEHFPEVKSQNARYSALSTLEKIVDDAETRISKHEPIPLSAWASGGAAGAGGLVHGGLGEAGIAAAGATALAKIVGNPKIRLKAAVALSKASEGALSVAAALKRLKGVSSVPGASDDVASRLIKPPSDVTPAGPLSRDAQGRFMSNKTRVQELAKF